MQCKHKHFIYYIDKKAVADDYLFLCGRNIFNIKALHAIGKGNIRAAINIMLTGKEWVFYDRYPWLSSNKTIKKLAQMGYFKFNELPCGKCEVCKTEKSKEWATKAYCEGKMWTNSCFVTFTYDPEHLPDNRKLHRAHIQKFWKDLRYHLYKETKTPGRWRRNKETGERYWEESIDMTEEREQLEEIYSNPLEDIFGKNARRKNRKPIRYLNCGEYGPTTKRPHYHAQVWNFIPTDLKYYKTDKRGPTITGRISRIQGSKRNKQNKY